MDLESSDRDKFDDGQELFGVTYCPGGDLSCGYGDLPRSSDSGYVGAAMPSWVKAPGNHPLVAAYPVPEMDVVESIAARADSDDRDDRSHHRVGHREIVQHGKDGGNKHSVANTETWNEWQESHTTSGSIVPGQLAAANRGADHPARSGNLPPVQGTLRCCMSA